MTPMMLMPIGRFAKASRLSVKSLRNYDQSGLLPAAYVDPQTGYRYYRLEQLARADTIRSLRMLDMSLPSIAATLDGDDPEQALRDHLARLKSQRDQLDAMAEQLGQRIQAGAFVMSNEITVKSTSAMAVAAFRADTTHTSIFEDIPAGFAKVVGALEAASIDPAGVPFTLYFQAPEADATGDIAMCVPIAAETDEIETISLPETHSAKVTHRGSYHDMGESYAAVSAWIHERGHRIVGPHREVYLNSPVDVAEAELLTEIQFPIDVEGQI